MEFEEMKDGYRVFLLPGEVQQLLDSAKEKVARRTRVMIWLMCLSLRIGTAVNVKAGDFFKDDGVWWIEVEGKASTKQYKESKSRKVWIPKPIKHKIDAYIDDKGLSDDDYLCDVEERQLSNDIQTTRKNAAIATGNEHFEKVTAHDFRRYFATQLIMRLGQDEEVVRQVGGWKEISHMWEYLLLPTDLVKRRLFDGGLLGSNPILMSGRGELEMVGQSFDALESLVEETDDDDVMDAVKGRLKEFVGRIDGIAVTVTDADGSGRVASTGETGSDQSNVDAFDYDEMNIYGPVAGLATGYWNRVGRVVDWTTARARPVWNQHVGFDFQAWLQEGTVRRICAFTFFMVLAIGMLTVPMTRMGIYIDPSTWTVAASQDGVLALLTAAAVYVGTSGNMWEKTLADLTGQERLADLLTLRIGDSA